MVLIGLLLLALVCLALGLVLTSSAWLIASLIASAGAALLLWRMGASAAAKPRSKPASAQPGPADAPTSFFPPEGPSAPSELEVWVIDGRPRYHLENCAIIQDQNAEPIPYSQAADDGFMPCSLCEPNVSRSVAS
jgi:hypothetical protein